jgi:hypothetical protein
VLPIATQGTDFSGLYFLKKLMTALGLQKQMALKSDRETLG